jgi:hypothetical protein
MLEESRAITLALRTTMGMSALARAISTQRVALIVGKHGT